MVIFSVDKWKCFLRVLQRVHLVKRWPASLNLHYSSDPILISALLTKPNNKLNFQGANEILSFFVIHSDSYERLQVQENVSVFSKNTCSSLFNRTKARFYKNLINTSSKRGCIIGEKGADVSVGHKQQGKELDRHWKINQESVNKSGFHVVLKLFLSK